VTARIALFLVLLAAAAPSLGVAAPPRQADLEAEIVCPTCKTTLDQSSSPIATRMKSYIRARIVAGDSAAEIKHQLVDQFGPAVLAEPPKRGFDLLAWLVPLAALSVGAVAVAALAWTWSRRRDGSAEQRATELDADLDRRVDEELARFDE
jgi:cytochrome c-type biogenesis protein CcmH